MTTESSKNGAITMSRVNFSGYVGHAPIFNRMLTTAQYGYIWVKSVVDG